MTNETSRSRPGKDLHIAPTTRRLTGVRVHVSVRGCREGNGGDGGYATLKYLYEYAPRVEGSEWGTKTPNASIRRIVQNRDRFFKIRPGLWALEARKDELPEHLYVESISPEKRDQYDHSYFQGLLAEVGNVRAADTWIPSQDKNQPFLDRTLADVRSLERFPAFGYERMVRRARTVDVVWFNDRRMPDSLLEVELSTNFQNLPHKFLNLRNYHANFVIVADETRKRQYEKRLDQTGFAPVRDRVDFVDFEEVSRLHSAAESADGIVQRL